MKMNACVAKISLINSNNFQNDLNSIIMHYVGSWTISQLD